MVHISKIIADIECRRFNDHHLLPHIFEELEGENYHVVVGYICFNCGNRFVATEGGFENVSL